MTSTPIIYFDNNATTMMPPSVIAEMQKWCNRGNPSASYASATQSREMMDDFRAYVGKLCRMDVRPSANLSSKQDNDKPSNKAANDAYTKNQYEILFTSGASEANSMIVRITADAYWQKRMNMPHFVCSAVEHKSILLAVESLVQQGRATATYVRPLPSGHILPQQIAAAINSSTCLVCVMHANNEIGAINDIKEIVKISHAKGVPVFSDAVQSFGKLPPQAGAMELDAFSVSVHKFYGPPGVGFIALRRAFIDAYGLKAYIFGSQNNHMRGGTENLPGIGASFAALKYAMINRQQKNAHLLSMKQDIIKNLAHAGIQCLRYQDYLTQVKPRITHLINQNTPIFIVFLSGNQDIYLPNTILLAVVKLRAPLVCNAKMKNCLEQQKIIVSVGSACNTSSSKASHVIDAIAGDDIYIRKGALRISLGDQNTHEEVGKFVSVFTRMIKSNACLGDK